MYITDWLNLFVTHYQNYKYLTSQLNMAELWWTRDQRRRTLFHNVAFASGVGRLLEDGSDAGHRFDFRSETGAVASGKLRSRIGAGSSPGRDARVTLTFGRTGRATSRYQLPTSFYRMLPVNAQLMQVTLATSGGVSWSWTVTDRARRDGSAVLDIGGRAAALSSRTWRSWVRAGSSPDSGSDATAGRAGREVAPNTPVSIDSWRSWYFSLEVYLCLLFQSRCPWT